MILNDLKSTMLHLAMQSTVRHIMEYQLGRDDGCTLQSSGPPCCFWHKSAHEPKPQKATWLERRRLVDPCSHHTSVESNKRKVYFPTHAFKCLSVQAYGTVFLMVSVSWFPLQATVVTVSSSQGPHSSRAAEELHCWRPNPWQQATIAPNNHHRPREPFCTTSYHLFMWHMLACVAHVGPWLSWWPRDIWIWISFII